MNRLFEIMTKKRQHRCEYCVLCHSETLYFYDTEIGERNFYVIGCGQLCLKCFDAVTQNEAAYLGGQNGKIQYKK